LICLVFLNLHTGKASIQGKISIDKPRIVLKTLKGMKTTMKVKKKKERKMRRTMRKMTRVDMWRWVMNLRMCLEIRPSWIR